MRISQWLLSSCIIVGLTTGSLLDNSSGARRRQINNNSGLPTLGSGSDSTSDSATPTASATSSADDALSTTQSDSSVSQTAETSRKESSSVKPTSTVQATPTESTAPTSTPAPESNDADSHPDVSSGLPLTPHITPALSVGGVVLLLTGIGYALIGVKNRWVHVSLSTAYLSSVSICVLIIYVMNPPVSNAIQGAYFVGIFMTGVIFGAGALVFKEVTEGLGCLLGGFCLAMWFLTLKEGGLITTTTGKAIFIAIFCVLAWGLSFSHLTRPYALIGSTSFSGATAFVLGVDCFSRGGLKEFWVYIWDLNPGLFPLNTNTYPITRGTRVETIVIVLGCIIGIISQAKLWRVVRERQKKREEALKDDARRQDAVEVALGRHLERRNDRDKSEWERQYGNLLHAKRETILWSDTHREKKAYSRISENEVGESPRPVSTDNLEMSSMPQQPRSVYVARVKRQSNLAVNTIEEVDEPEPAEKQNQQERSLARLEGKKSTEMLKDKARSPMTGPSPSPRPPYSQESLKPNPPDRPYSQNLGQLSRSRDESPAPLAGEESSRHLTPPTEPKKRRSWSSVFSGKENEGSSKANASQEALIISQESLNHSRASSLAATLDSENEIQDLQVDTAVSHVRPPPGIVAPGTRPPDSGVELSKEKSLEELHATELEEEFDDPEALIRPPTALDKSGVSEQRRQFQPQSASQRNSLKRRSGPESEVGTEILFEENLGSHADTSETSYSDVLTKGALDKVPSHMSNVVMSYRTNEWAKHISAADAPLYEEPAIIVEEEESEEPAHLVSPEEAQKQAIVTQPPPLSRSTTSTSVHSPVEAAVSTPSEGMKVNPAAQPPQPVKPTSNVNSIPSVEPQISIPRTRANSELVRNNSATRGLRSGSTPMLSQTLVSSPIDENAAVDFAQQQTAMRSASSASLHRLSGGNSAAFTQPQNFPVYGGNHPYGGQHPYGSAHQIQGVARSTSRLSNVSEVGTGPMRSASQLSLHQPKAPLASKSETRLTAFDSHQPLRRNTSAEAQRREAMFADWRMSQQRSQTPNDFAEATHAQRVWEKQQAKQIQEHEKTTKMQQEMQLEVVMRGRDMQEAHRAALRKMQAGVNKKLT